MTPLGFFHLGAELTLGAASTGNPMYDVPGDHLPALLALFALPIVAAVIRVAARYVPFAARLLAGYQARPPLHRLAAWLLAATAVLHLTLVGHHDGVLGILMIVDGVLLGLTTLLLLTGRRWRPLAGALLVGSLIAWAGVTIAGSAPDQVGMVTKLIELAALAIVLTPVSGARIRGAMAALTMVLAVILVDAAAWMGAFTGAGVGHHAGAVPAPGVLLPAGEDRPPTLAEQTAADILWLGTVVALARYEDPAVAIADGYAADGISGLDFHAANPAHGEDGRVLDPARPENLLYAESPAGPVLLGAMFEMAPGQGPGPTFGGPLTIWHGHEQVCLTLTGIAGLVSPMGGCPMGSVAIPRTGEMLHVWTAPGAPTRWGELDDEWKAAYVAAVAEHRLAAAGRPEVAAR